MMIRIPYEDILAKIQEKSDLSKEAIEEKVQQKLVQLSGLISKEGAANIVANELGIKLLEATGKIKDIYAGMRNVETTGKVQQVYDVREFQRSDNTPSKVGTFLIGDETGVMRIVCWGDKADIVSKIEKDAIVKVVGAYCRDNQGRAELHCNDQTNIILNPPGVTIGEVKARQDATRKAINALQESDNNAEIMGTVVQVFDPRFFASCPTCNKKVEEVEGQFTCQEHGSVQPKYGAVLSAVMDDGTENIRCVFFRGQAAKFLNITEEKLAEYRTAPETFEDVKIALLGEQFKITGRAKNNTFFNRLEFVAQNVVPANAQEELDKLNAESPA